jgi:hypothetical protein
MIKYIIIKYIPDGYGGNLSEEKIIRKSELKMYLEDGWVLHKKIIPIITIFIDWWKPISLANKIAIIGILIPTIIAVLFGVLAHLSNKENDSLKNENKTLNENYNQLKHNLILTADSLNSERKNLKYLLQKSKAKNVFK